MKRISSILTIPCKIILFFKGSFFLAFALFFATKDKIAASILCIVAIIMILLAKYLKNVYIVGEDLYVKGLISSKKYVKSDIEHVGDFLFINYIKLKTKKRVLFLKTVKDELNAYKESIEAVNENIVNKINE